MFLSMDLILLFYRWVFAVMLFKKVRCDPFEVAVFHYISVCFWSSVTLAINYLMQSAQCLPAHAGSVCCWWRGRNKGSNNWNWPIKKQCCKTCLSQHDHVPDTDGQSHKENPDKSRYLMPALLCLCWSSWPQARAQCNDGMFSSTENWLPLQKQRQIHGDGLP